MLALVALVGLSMLTQGCVGGTWKCKTTVTETVNGEENEVYSSNAEGDIVSGADFGLPFPVLRVNSSDVNGETVIGGDEEELADEEEIADGDVIAEEQTEEVAEAEEAEETEEETAEATDEEAAAEETTEEIAETPEDEAEEADDAAALIADLREVLDGWDKNYQGIGQ